MKKINLGIISAVFLLIAAGIFYQIVWAFPPTPPANTSVAAITSGTITGANIINTPISGSTGSFTTLSTTDNATIGSAAAGKNLTVNATLGTELSPALTGATGVNWTFAGTYTTPLNNTIEKAGAGTNTITPVTQSIVVGTVYQVVIVVDAFTAGSATYTLGGITGTSLSAAGTYTDYITAGYTSKLIITPTDAARFVISSISVKALTPATGNAIINGNIYSNSSIYAGRSGSTYPAYSFRGNTGSGMYTDGTYVYIVGSGGAYIKIGGGTSISSNTGFSTKSDTLTYKLGSSDDVIIARDAANTLALRNGANQQKFNIYNTYTSATDYERLSVAGIIGTSVNINAETATNGADNLDILLTPAGTGGVGIRPPTEATGGGFVTKIANATSAALSGASGSIAVNVPSGKRILSVQLRVNTAITSGDGGTTWTAAYVNTPTTAIGSGYAFTVNTKVNIIHPAYELTTDTVTITVTPNSGTFSGGVVEAFVYYETNIDLANKP